MKLAFRFTLLFSIALIAGCGREGAREDHDHDDANHEHAAAHVAEGVTYSEKKGLRVPAATAKFIDLRTEEISERSMDNATAFEAEVYETRKVSADALAFATIPEQQATNLPKGVALEVRAPTGTTLRGRVINITPHDATARSKTVLLAIDDPNGNLTSGSAVSVRGPRVPSANVVAIPSSALLRTIEGEFVYTVSGDHFVRAAVKTGDSHGDFIEIKDGLYAGDHVVTRAAMTLWLAELHAIRGGKACADGD